MVHLFAVNRQCDRRFCSCLSVQEKWINVSLIKQIDLIRKILAKSFNFLIYSRISLFRTFPISNYPYVKLSLSRTFPISNFPYIELSLCRTFPISNFPYVELFFLVPCEVEIESVSFWRRNNIRATCCSYVSLWTIKAIFLSLSRTFTISIFFLGRFRSREERESTVLATVSWHEPYSL